MLDSEIKILKSLIISATVAEQHLEKISPSGWNGEYNKKAALDDIRFILRSLNNLLENK